MDHPGSNISHAQDGSTILVAKQLSLRSGRNVLEVIAYNRHNEVKSRPQQLTLTLVEPLPQATAPKKLYVVAVGINHYRENSIDPLRYTVSDAQALVAALRRIGRRLFEAIIPFEVTDTQATRQGIETTLKAVAAQAQPQDVFVFYLAGHGVVQKGLYHFLPYDIQSPDGDAIYRGAKYPTKSFLT